MPGPRFPLVAKRAEKEFVKESGDATILIHEMEEIRVKDLIKRLRHIHFDRIKSFN